MASTKPAPMSADLYALRRRVRRRYEWHRVGFAFIGVAPLALLVVAVMMLTHRPAAALVFGGAALTLAVLALWWGRQLRRSVLLGVGAGLLPLAAGLVANHLHACGSSMCTTLCVPACSLAGLVAGAFVAGVVVRRRDGATAWLGSASLALTTGAMGCACVGHAGVLGMVLGFVTGALPALARR